MTKHAPRYQKSPGHVYAHEFCQDYFGRSFDWFKRNRKVLERAWGFPPPIPPGGQLIYYADAVAAWRAAQVERARRGALAQRLNVVVERTAFSPAEAEAEGETPNWPALKARP